MRERAYLSAAAERAPKAPQIGGEDAADGLRQRPLPGSDGLESLDRGARLGRPIGREIGKRIVQPRRDAPVETLAAGSELPEARRLLLDVRREQVGTRAAAVQAGADDHAPVVDRGR